MSAPVAPLSPNSNASIVTTPQTGGSTATKSAVEQASDDARARVAAGGSALPPGAQPLPAGAQPPQARVPANNGAESGRFASPNDPRVDPNAAPPAGQAPAAPAAPAPKVEPPKPGDAPAGGQPEGEETPEQIAEREAAEALIVELPLAEGEMEPMALTFETPEQAARFREIVESSTSAEDAMALVERAQAQVAEVDDMRDYAETDPVGFVVDMLDGNVDNAQAIVTYLLAQPTLYNAMKPVLAKLATEQGFREVALDAREGRTKAEESAARAIQGARAERQNAQEIEAVVVAMLPPSFNAAQRRVAFADMLRDVRDYAVGNRLRTVPIEHLSAVLEDRLIALGIDPDAATARAAAAHAKRSPARVPVRGSTPKGPTKVAPRTPAPRPPGAPQTPGRRTGAAFVKAADARARAGSIPSGGAGSPTNTPALQVPRKQDGSAMGIEETLAWHRAQKAAGKGFLQPTR